MTMFWNKSAVSLTLSIKICLCIILSIDGLNAQDLLEQGKQEFTDQNWTEARDKFQQVLAADSLVGEAWFYLGLTYISLNQIDKALLAYENADNLGFAPVQTRYNIACAYSLLDEKGKSIQALAGAINAGFNQLHLLSSDPDLVNIRNEPEFQELFMQLEQQIYPCLHNPKYQEFNFWLGEWEVFNPQGQKVGENYIRKLMQGCLIQENWTSARGSRGTSINYYDPATNKWKQNWVDENGRVIWYNGEYKENVMHFKGELINPDGTVEQAQVTLELEPTGNVRHIIKHSKDDGKSWYTWFDGLYVKKITEADTGK
ncbi:MAG: hypothetical protein JSW33_04090 [bacterium]|nr:MAG: hypothetical protein JSW33_04090 [bacterium]